ncbi:MAG: aminoglycoside phosphotransferase family protein [Ignavibacteriales bacterium]|nr:aminoglycoside phosphotransferase family protein [Ignavibacteriales bacterium]
MKDYESIFNNFQIEGTFLNAIPFGSGHINDTILVTIDQSEKIIKYILRKINSYVFKEPKLIIENTVSVTNHIEKKILKSNKSETLNRTLKLFKTKNDDFYFIDNEDNYWCVFNFIEDAITYDNVNTEDQAFEAAKEYGKFQKYLSDFEIVKCHTTIPDFHNLSNRLAKFYNLLKNHKYKRIESSEREIQLVEKFRHIEKEFLQLKNLNIPLRITHNDTKINNVMLDEKTKKGLCVIDLDTVMPGIILNDFGDMVRSFVSPTLEDSSDYSKVKVRLNIFEALANGYLSETNNILTKDEKENLLVGAKIIIYEQAIRFLTDYIEGDVYYKINFTNHNLVRAKNQFALLEDVELNLKIMESIINKYRKWV